jgi:hypothetical protein
MPAMLICLPGRPEPDRWTASGTHEQGASRTLLRSVVKFSRSREGQHQDSDEGHDREHGKADALMLATAQAAMRDKTAARATGGPMSPARLVRVQDERPRSACR